MFKVLIFYTLAAIISLVMVLVTTGFGYVTGMALDYILNTQSYAALGQVVAFVTSLVGSIVWGMFLAQLPE